MIGIANSVLPITFTREHQTAASRRSTAIGERWKDKDARQEQGDVYGAERHSYVDSRGLRRHRVREFEYEEILLR